MNHQLKKLAAKPDYLSSSPQNQAAAKENQPWRRITPHTRACTHTINNQTTVKKKL